MGDIAGIEVAVIETAEEHGGEFAAEMVDLAITELKGRIGDSGIIPAKFMTIVRYAMEIVETKPVKGEAQKRLVMRILGDLLKNADMGENERKICNDLIESGSVENTIDLIIDASRGRINVNAVAEVATGCFLTCLKSFMGRKKKRNVKGQA